MASSLAQSMCIGELLLLFFFIYGKGQITRIGVRVNC